MLLPHRLPLLRVDLRELLLVLVRHPLSLLRSRQSVGDEAQIGEVRPTLPGDLFGLEGLSHLVLVGVPILPFLFCGPKVRQVEAVPQVKESAVWQLGFWLVRDVTVDVGPC